MAEKQILLFLNRQTSFILEDLDDYHVLIRRDMEAYVRSQLEQEVSLSSILVHHETNPAQLEKNTYSLE